MIDVKMRFNRVGYYHFPPPRSRMGQVDSHNHPSSELGLDFIPFLNRLCVHAAGSSMGV